MDMWWDWSHGATRDHEGALKACGLWALWLLLLVVVNMKHGPDKDECQRMQQYIDQVSKYMAIMAPGSAVLFQNYLEASSLCIGPTLIHVYTYM